MAFTVRRPGPVQQAAPAGERVAFGDLANYGGGDFLIPEGKYAIFHDVRVHAYQKQDGSQGQQMLGVMLTAYNLETGEEHTQFLSLGRKAKDAYAPDPDNPADNGIGSKSLVKIPGQNATLAGMTNWNLYLKSLYDAGLPEGTFTDDVSALDGIWAHLKHVLEPESRKALGAATGEVQQQRNTGPQKIAIVDEILDDGKPWEGTGGMPEVAEAPAPKAAPKAAAKAPVKTAPAAVKKTAPKPAPAPEPEAEEGDNSAVIDAARDAIVSVLSENPNGMKRLMLRTKAFGLIKKSAGDETAQAATETVFNDDAVLGQLLGEAGFSLKGNDVAAA